MQHAICSFRSARKAWHSRLSLTLAMTAGCGGVTALLEPAAAAGQRSWQQPSGAVRYDVTRDRIGPPPRVGVDIVEGIGGEAVNRMTPPAVEIRLDVDGPSPGAPADAAAIIDEITAAERINRMPAPGVLIIEGVSGDRVNRMPPVDVDVRHGVEEWYIGQPEPVAVSIVYGPSIEPRAAIDQGPAPSTAAGVTHPRRHPAAVRQARFTGRPSPWSAPVWAYQRVDDIYLPRQPQRYCRADDTYMPTRTWRYTPRRDFTWTPWVWRRY
jgi:hypothetical protein